jgi:hypothetical protein
MDIGLSCVRQSRCRKSAQGAKWNFCLTAGTLLPANQERPCRDDRAAMRGRSSNMDIGLSCVRRGRRKRHPCDSSMRGLRRLNQYVTHANPKTIDLQRMNY